MAVVLALPMLFDAVVVRFALDGTAIPNAFGWRPPAQQYPAGPRISWIPGDSSGSLGEILPAKQPGRNPRPLGTLAELFTVEIRSNDAASPEEERAQYQAVREAFDAWWRAAYLAAPGRLVVKSAAWIIDRKERRYGAALRAVCSIEAMIPDAPLETAPVDTRAVVALAELDHTENVETAPAP